MSPIGSRAVGERPSLDVVIVSYHSQETLPLAVASLASIPDEWDVRLFLHDNSNDADSCAGAVILAEEMGLPNLVTLCSANCGFGAGCNEGAARGSGRYILFLNPDAVITKWPAQWIPTPGIYGPSIVNSAGRVQRLYGRSRSVAAEFIRIAGRRPLTPKGTGYVSGASLLIDRVTFERIGGFDENFFMYYEDIDLCLRAVGDGMPVQVEASWNVSHIGGVSANYDKPTSTRTIRESVRSSIYFHRKHEHNWRLFAKTMCHYFQMRSLVARLSGHEGKRERYREWHEAFLEELSSDST